MLRSTLSSWREYLTPVRHTSNYRETGEITPEEFVQAGDYLVYKFPTWSWSGAPKSKTRDFLPADKQYLITRHVPSYFRASAVDGSGAAAEGGLFSDEKDEEDGWTSTHHSGAAEPCRELETPTEPPEAESNDIDELLEAAEDEEEEDDATYRPPSSSAGGLAAGSATASATAAATRSYNLYITYSTSYRVPKMYLEGFDADGTPLTPEKMYEDIVGDYKDKTVTIERAPFAENTTMISIHPCRHANVMKVLMDRTIANMREKKAGKAGKSEAELTRGISKLGLVDSEDPQGVETEWEEIEHGEGSDDDVFRVDKYLVVFLKFISSVTPGIEHDYTMDAY